MSRRATPGSKFGHLFGDADTPLSSSSSSGGDLYHDPLAALLPSSTVTTTTTRSSASTAKATLSSPSPTTSSTAATGAGGASSKSSPPGSTPNSRSSSRLQHQSLFSSLTSDGGSSLFDSATPASASLSAAKRDLLFGESTSSSTGSSLRRTSTPPLAKGSSTTTNSQQSSRMSTPPHGVRLTTTTLDANDSPLGALLGDQDKDDDMTSIRSPLSTEPLTRTNSQASMKSLDSGQSVKSVQSQDTNGSTKPAATTAGPSPLSAVRSSHVRKPSVDQVQQPSKPTASAGPTKPVFNPLVDSPARPASATSAQSIEAFQSLSRASSPAISTLPVSKSGFERETDSPVSPPISQSKAPVRVDIMDDAAEAFAKDMLLSPGASESVSTSTLGSSSFLDSGLATSQSMASFSADVFSKPDPISTSMTATVSTTSTTTTSHDVGTPALKSGSKPTGGFSLGVDMADPWTTNSFADSLEHTTLSTTRIDYTQSSHSSNLASESMFSLPPSSSSSFSATTTTTTTTTMPPTPAPPKTVAPKRPMTPVTIPSLEDDIGGFGDVISPLRSNNTPSLSVPPSLTAELSRQRSPSPMVLGLSSSSTSTWNILDAVEAATLDPDFQGPTSLMNQSTDKVLAIMQMPRDALDKDVSAMEVFDNPWE